MDEKEFKVFSTFSGIGGFEVGIRNAYRSSFGGIQEDTKRDEGTGLLSEKGEDSSSSERSISQRNNDELNERPLFVGYSEIDKYADSVYQKQFGGKNYGDITKINAEELPDFDCLVGGFPCQAFSIAGKRGGFEDTRGTLFFDLARILKAKQPRLFVFENVKGLLSHDSGKTFRTIISTIAELGYDAQWQVVNSKNFGVPQNRERVIIVGHLRGTARPEVFPIPGSNKETSNPDAGKGQIVDLTRREPSSYRVRSDNRAGTLDANYYKGLANQERPGVLVGTLRTHNDGKGFRVSKSGLSPTIPARAREDGSGQPVVSITQRGRGKNKGGEHLLAPTMSSHSWQDNNHLNDGHGIRRLTPLECERLQAFPDEWTKTGKDGELISDTQRYKMCGNAVTTNVIQAVFEKIFAKNPKNVDF